MRISDITPDVLFRAYVARGWKPFTEGDYNLNIIGIRADDRKSNTFNDLICLLYKTAGRWVFRKYAATTDPGLYYRQNPLNPRGTAILKDGYYRGAFGIGLHHGQYRCLVQTKPLPLWRDGNRDGVFDFGGKVSEEMADILWVLIALANQTGVDLTAALLRSIEKKTRRDSMRHKLNPKLAPQPDGRHDDR